MDETTMNDVLCVGQMLLMASRIARLTFSKHLLSFEFLIFRHYASSRRRSTHE